MTYRKSFAFPIACGLFAALCSVSAAAETSELGGTLPITVEPSERGMAVKADGKPFTEYLTRSGSKPVLYPLVGPTGAKLTRGWPIVPLAKGEKDDHHHHRSLWFTQEGLNGVNFWLEPQEGQPLAGHAGEIVHREFVRSEADGNEGIIQTQNDWRDAKGNKICEDETTYRFAAHDDLRVIDFQVDLHASEKDLEIMDSKEGTFAVRVAGPMSVDNKQGGRIVNSRGQEDASAWGMPAEWVDYQGPVDGQEVGLAILSHPSNFRPAPRWHVRTYGLFAANPFGEKDFPPVEGYKQGSITIPKGDTLTLRYRVLLHSGDEKQADIAEHYHRYAGKQAAQQD
ncbi:MAG: PmoA family protein [Pirellulales bacterium]